MKNGLFLLSFPFFLNYIRFSGNFFISGLPANPLINICINRLTIAFVGFKLSELNFCFYCLWFCINNSTLSAKHYIILFSKESSKQAYFSFSYKSNNFFFIYLYFNIFNLLFLLIYIFLLFLLLAFFFPLILLLMIL